MLTLVPNASAASDPHYIATFPGYGTAITVPAAVETRSVTLPVVFGASATGSELTVSIKGIVTPLADAQPFVTATTGAVETVSFAVAGGTTYYVNRSSSAASVESYSYVDVYSDCDSLPCESGSHANATWESRQHANASWCPVPACAVNGDQLVAKSYADTTYEGQHHANATWCPIAGCTFAGPISAPQLTVGGPVTANDLTVQGQVNTSTAWDPYVGMIVFGGLTLVTVLIGVWGLRQQALAAKVALVGFLVIAAIWAANQTTTTNANAVRWVAVVIMSGLALLLAATAKPTRG